MEVEEKNPIAEAIAKLPGDLRRIAEVTDLKTALIIADKFGGGPLIIPKCDELSREIRNKKIRDEYNSTKITIRELAWQYDLTEKTIRTILNETGEEVPPPLLELMMK